MPVSRYVTLRTVKHSGSEFPVGTPMALSDEYAAPLLAIGAIQAQAGALPAMPTVPGDVVRETVDTGSGGKARTYVEAIPSEQGLRKLRTAQGDAQFRGAQPAMKPTLYMVNANAQNSSSANVTRHGMRKLLKPFIAWRATVYHYLAAGVNYKVAISARQSDTEIYNSFGTWYTATFAGAGSVALGAGSGSGTNPNHVFATATSDLMFTPAEVTGNRLYLRSNADLAGNTRMDFSQSINNQNSGGLLFAGAYHNGTDGIADPTAFTPTPHNSMPPLKIETFGHEDVFSMLWCGSSTVGGQGDTETLGMVFRAETTLNLQHPDVAWSFTNISAPGSTTAASLARGIAELARTRYSAAAYSIFSTNNTDKATAAGLEACKRAIVTWLETCYQYGVEPVLSTFQPGTTMDAGTYANCLELRLFALHLQDIGACTVLDFAELWGDLTSATPAWKDAAKTTDGTHPNALGHVDGGSLIVNKVSRMRFAA